MIDTLQQLRSLAYSVARWMSTEQAGPLLMTGGMIALAVAGLRMAADRMIGTRRHPLLYAGEPAMAEVLDDPIIRSLMARDGVARDSLDDLIAVARRKA